VKLKPARSTRADFNRTIEIKEREGIRVKLFISRKPYEKRLFLRYSGSRLLVRESLTNITEETPTIPAWYRNYGALGDLYLRDFQETKKPFRIFLHVAKALEGVDAT
jgi:hypothetical protein